VGDRNHLALVLGGCLLRALQNRNVAAKLEVIPRFMVFYSWSSLRTTFVVGQQQLGYFMVWDFFANLGRQRINAVQAKVKGKGMGAVAKAKSKAANSVNKAVDGAANKAGNKAKGVASGKDGKKKSDKAEAKKKIKGEKSMGLFGRKKQGGEDHVEPEAEPEASFGEKTQFIQVMEEDQKRKPCVGWIVCVNGGLQGTDFRLVPGKNVIGTAADCEVVLTDQYLSSRHAVIRYEEGRFTLVDLDSTNGTYVNEERVAKEEIIDNDSIRLGRSQLKFKALY
jgi:hypothetical protein